ncbi:thioredoxin [[Clostridium] sordellii]|uniref:TlpA family protein disulfide reductase n=1 Tax=Paraclostridium sordellii TaxID=1505 RepID=UPI0005E0958B|nr:TlpA disulfide reductase family protein [Paeniclostridium sordellii]CEQ29801.1 thioredoxin [[Clostridium] sordellii] [Paeniclostridium sordellii]
MNIKKIKKNIVLILSIIFTVGIVGCTSNSSSSSNVFKNMKTTNINGNKVDGSIFADKKLTLINVWNTGCTPCIDEIPILDKINKEYETKGVSIKGLILESGLGLKDKEKKVVEEILEKSKATYQQLILSSEMLDSDVFKMLDVVPTTFFVDKNGNIVEKVEGANDYKGWKNKIKEVLKKVDGSE